MSNDGFSMNAEWISLILNPQALLGAYSQKPPSLCGFKLDRVLLASSEIKLEGQFATLPLPLPQTWVQDGRPRADGVIWLTDVRAIRISGLPRSGPNDDSMHGWREGLPVDFDLCDTGEVFLQGNFGSRPWCRLTGTGAGFDFFAEAGNVYVLPGPKHIGGR